MSSFLSFSVLPPPRPTRSNKITWTLGHTWFDIPVKVGECDLQQIKEFKLLDPQTGTYHEQWEFQFEISFLLL